MKTWIIAGIVAAVLIGLWLWSQGGRIIEGTVDDVATTTLEEIGGNEENLPNENEANETTSVQIALIALEDNGATGKKIGCNDSVVLIDQEVPATTAPLRAALLQLLSIDEPTYGASGLHTALADKDIELADVSIADGEAIIELEGNLSLGGVCEAPRIQAQLVETALQFPTVNEVTILLNDEPLEEVLSEA